jgi:hypothetical protein
MGRPDESLKRKTKLAAILYCKLCMVVLLQIYINLGNLNLHVNHCTKYETVTNTDKSVSKLWGNNHV